MMRPTAILHPLVATIKQLALIVLCGVLFGSSALLAQDSPAGQPPQPPQSKQITPQTHLRQGQPGVYQSFQPCRMVDTRNPDGPFGGPKLAAGGTRNFSLVPSGGDCGDTLPPGVTALAMNMTITGTENGGFLTVWPGGQAQPNSSVINWSSSGTTIANAIIVPVGADGSINIFSSQPTHVILDVSGYYLSSLETDDQLAIVANNTTAAIVGQNNGEGAGVRGEGASGPGVYGQSATGPAGQFAGNVEVAGNVTVSGDGNGIVFADGTTQTTAATGGGEGGVGGTGTAGMLPLWSSGTELGDSVITQVNDNVGIGVTPSAGIKLDVNGNTLFRFPNANIQFGTPNSETGMTIIGSARADLRFDGTTFKMVAGPLGGPPASTNGIAINTVGNVGIGTSPASLGSKLFIAGQDAITASGFQPFITMTDTDTSGGPLVSFPFRRIQTVGNNLVFQSRPTCFNFPCPPTTTQMILNGVGNLGIGTVNPTTRLHVVGTARTSVLEITGGSDLAEHFEVADGAKPGMVVAIDARNAGRLSVARGAYNRRVAGIISGAKNLNAGMVLPDLVASDKSQPLALSGRVWVYADASRGAIRPGDLLTTSATPGHAMRVANYSRAQGAIIGKAMTGLKSGRGLVLVLVTLQ